MDSLVRVVVHDNWGLTAHEDLGFVTKDANGTIGVLTSSRVIDRTIDTGTGKNLIGIYNNTNKFFPLKEIKKISPGDNLILLKLEGDITDKGRRTPLSLAESFREKEPLFYIIWETHNSSAIIHFRTERVQHTVNLSDRQDFIISSDFTEISPEESSNSLILNSRGEVVSFVSSGTLYTLFGTPVEKIKGFLSGPSENCSLLFLKGCLIRARKTLYGEAKSENSRAGYEIIRSFLREESFEMFMRSIGINDPIQIKKDWEFFLKKSAEWDEKPYFSWIVDNESMTEEEQRERLLSLEQMSKVLAEQDHPHFQYLLALIYSQLRNSPQRIYWAEQAAKKKYIPALFMTGSLYLIEGIGELKELARENHALANQLLGLLHHDFSNAMDFLKEYTGYKPLRPSGRSPTRSSFQPVHIFRENNLPAVIEWSIYSQNVLFSLNLKKVKAGLDLIHEAAEGGFSYAKKLLNNFEKSMALARKPEEPIYMLSPFQERECRDFFTRHFTSSKK